MNIYTRITVPLTKDDFVTLRDAAAKEYRHPREHAAWLLRQVLSSEQQADAPQKQPQAQPAQQEVAA